MSPILAAFLRSTVLPAALAAVGLFLTGGRPDPFRERLQAFLLALAYGFGSYMLLDHLEFPPHDANGSFPFLALICALFVFVAPKEAGSRYTLRALFVLALGALLLWPIHESLTGPAHFRNLVAFFCLCLGMWSIAERSYHVVALPTLLILPLISATATSLLLLFSASASLSQLVTVLCGQLGAALVVGLIWPSRLAVGALVPFLSVFIGCFMSFGHFYLEINPWHLIYLCFPFLLLWIRAWLPVSRNVWIEAFVLSLVAAAPLGYFLWTVFQASGPLY